MVSTGMTSGTAFQPPELFTFSKAEEWLRWIWRLERFRDASGLNEIGEKKQVSTLLYSMGTNKRKFCNVFDLLQRTWNCTQQ